MLTLVGDILVATPHPDIDQYRREASTSTIDGLAADVTCAGLIDAALRDTSLLDALDEEALYRFGCHAASAAAITVQRPGADPPTRDELTRATRAAAVKGCTNASIGVFAY